MKRKEVLDALDSLKGPVQVDDGRLARCICEEIEDERAVLYLEQWHGQTHGKRSKSVF